LSRATSTASPAEMSSAFNFRLLSVLTSPRRSLNRPRASSCSCRAKSRADHPTPSEPARLPRHPCAPAQSGRGLLFSLGVCQRASASLIQRLDTSPAVGVSSATL
jgi:hypothetical protein